MAAVDAATGEVLSTRSPVRDMPLKTGYELRLREQEIKQV